MGIRDFISRAIGKDYRLGSANTNPLQIFEMQAPPGWGYQTYLKAYGEIGILYACVNVIAQAVAKVQWHLYELDAEGEKTEIFKHPLIDLFNNLNPFQTRYQFFYLGTMYKLLVGEQFWVLNLKGRIPEEIWLAPPSYMSVIPHPTDYISHYEFRRSGMQKPIPFTVEEVIHIKTPNPFNEYRGLSPAQALTVDLDSERYAARYQQKLFFNDATPGFVLEYPAEGMPPAEQRKELMQEWDERFKGFRNRGKTAFLFGAKANVLTMSNRDMDFAMLRKFNREAIMSAYHVPPSVVGITEHVNRSNAEASQYDFAQYCVHPELAEIREALNKEICPLFGDNLWLDFETPVPEDTTNIVTNTVNLFKAGIITRNDALDAIGMEQLEGPEGEEYASPASPFGLPDLVPAKRVRVTLEKPLEIKRGKIFESEEQREAYWKDYVSRAESYESKTIYELQKMYSEQKAVALAKFRDNPSKDLELIDLKESKRQYTTAITPILTQVMDGAIKNGLNLLEPVNPHKDGGEILPVLSQTALAWLKTRIGWAADQLGEETASRLANVLARGYEEGLSVDQIAAGISLEFDYFSDVRAQRIARTEIMQASSQGAIEGYTEAGVEKVEFYAALDERTCPDCMALHKEIYPLTESIGIITVHPNCLLPDNKVLPLGLELATQASYEGQAIEITTAFGDKISVTPNHPVLTPQGFILAKFLHEGDYVIGSSNSQRIAFSIDPYNQDTPTFIEDIWQSLSHKVGMMRTTMPVASEDFYGDAGGFNGDVDIITSNRFLLDNIYTLHSEHIAEDNFYGRYSQTPILPRYGALSTFSDSLMPPFSNNMRGSSQIVTFCDCHTSHAQDIGLTTITGLNTCSQEPAPDSSPIYTELSRQFQFRFSGLVTPQQITKIRQFFYSGHVYDLQSSQGLYISNNTVVKNCRCVWLPVV